MEQNTEQIADVPQKKSRGLIFYIWRFIYNLSNEHDCPEELMMGLSVAVGVWIAIVTAFCMTKLYALFELNYILSFLYTIGVIVFGVVEVIAVVIVMGIAADKNPEDVYG